MQASDYLFLFLAMGLVTYIPRSVPLLFLSRVQLPQWLKDWLSFIPVAILSALLAPLLFCATQEETRILTVEKPELLIAVPTLIFAWKTKSLGGTVLVGMLLFWGYKTFFLF